MTFGATGICAACEAGQPVVRPRGVITSDRAAALAQLLETAKANAEAAGRVIVDLSHVELLGGEAIGMLVARNDLELRNAGARLRRQLALVRLQRLLDADPA